MVNRAHDDFLESFLESGVLAMAVVAGFAAWLIGSTRASLMGHFGVEQRQARAAIIVLWLLALHSTVDYPLRTIALGCVFGLCAALQSPPPPASEKRLDAWWSGWTKRRKKRRKRRTHRKPAVAVEA